MLKYTEQVMYIPEAVIHKNNTNILIIFKMIYTIL